MRHRGLVLTDILKSKHQALRATTDTQYPKENFVCWTNSLLNKRKISGVGGRKGKLNQPKLNRKGPNRIEQWSEFVKANQVFIDYIFVLFCFSLFQEKQFSHFPRLSHGIMSGGFFYEHIIESLLNLPQDANNNVEKPKKQTVKKPKKK